MIIPVNKLVDGLNAMLNLQLNEADRKFYIVPDGDNYTPPERNGNDVIQFIEGVASVTNSTIIPIKNVEVITETLSVEIIVRLIERKGVKDEDIFLPVRNAISAYFGKAVVTQMTGDDDKVYSVAFYGTQPETGDIMNRPPYGRSITYYFDVVYQFIENGVNSADIELTFEDEPVSFENLTITRTAVTDGGAFAGTNGSARNYNAKTGFELDFNAPMLVGNKLSQALVDFLLKGTEKIYTVTVKTPFDETPAAYNMIFAPSSASIQGILNCGNSITLIEAYKGNGTEV